MRVFDRKPLGTERRASRPLTDPAAVPTGTALQIETETSTDRLERGRSPELELEVARAKEIHQASDGHGLSPAAVMTVAAAAALLAMLALWLRYNGPDTSLSFEIMIDVLLIVVIGGMGTMYGAAIGSVVFLVAQSYLQDLLKLASGAASGVPLLSALLSPDRWLLWLGLLFVLSVYYFPTGVVGRLRAASSREPSRK